MTTITSPAWLAPLMRYVVCQTTNILNPVARARSDAEVETDRVAAAKVEGNGKIATDNSPRSLTPTNGW